MDSTMASRSADTDIEADEVQMALLRQAGVGRRARMALSLSAQVIGLAHQAIRRALPRATDEDVRLRFVELHYGPDLAADVRRFLASRRR
jgi:hypothetical protein